MDSGFRDFEEYARDCKNHLASNFQIILYGPYSGICKAVLQEICNQLERESYEACICSDYPDPEIPCNASDDRKNWLQSRKCLEESDGAVFVFFDYLDGRFPNWDGNVHELNSSVIRELSYWIDSLNRPPSRTLVAFEGDVRSKASGLIAGSVEEYECREATFDGRDYEELFDYIEAACSSWIRE